MQPIVRWLVAITMAGMALVPAPSRAESAQVARGRYLVQLGGCTDCHTPGHRLGHPDPSRFLAGADVGFDVPHLGVFVPPNLTPDKDTGIGSWSSDQIVTAIRTGKTPEGRDLFPVMPWPALSHLTDDDAQAIAAFLKSIPAVDNKNAGPIGPNEKATVFVSVTLPADAYNAMQAKK